MKYLALGLFALVSASAMALPPAPNTAEAPAAPPSERTIELPSSTVQRVVNLLIMEHGTIAFSILRDIGDCSQNQGSIVTHVGGQDLCPAVTASIKARSDALTKAVDEAAKGVGVAPGSTP